MQHTSSGLYLERTPPSLNSLRTSLSVLLESDNKQTNRCQMQRMTQRRVAAAGYKLEMLDGHNESIRCSFVMLSTRQSRNTFLSPGYTLDARRFLPRCEARVQHYTALVSYLPDFQACHVTSRHVAFRSDVETVAFGVGFQVLVFREMFDIQFQPRGIQLVSYTRPRRTVYTKTEHW